MSSDSQDSEGEDLGTLRPTLIEELRNILDLYPYDGQILKELIQNAEDAGATIVKVLIDKRHFHQQIDQRTLKSHQHLKFFKGPALCVYNDAKFTDNDWEGIRMLHKSIKKSDPLKVGRFGLGFKSVFHLTDRLVILSGDNIMYMDPFKGEDCSCNLRRVAGRKGKELQSILHCLDGMFGICGDTFQTGSGHFPGTLFWFPLRQSASDLSSIVHSDKNIEDLLASFKTEAPSLLLFLNHIQHVYIMAKNDDHTLEELFSVGIAESCLRTVQLERDRFVKDITSAGSDLPLDETFCITEILMETNDHTEPSSTRQQWLIANYHCGQRQISHDLAKLCSDSQLSYCPYVGVAIPLTHCNSFQSQVFCFLPLPLDTCSPTGLPVHVHGYFALEQNRRHVKWPTADQLYNHAKCDSQSQWNCLLVTELLPKVYHRAILRLLELSTSNSEVFYRAWPDVNGVHDRWKPLLNPLYSCLSQSAVFFSCNRGSQWVSLPNAMLQYFEQPFSKEVQSSVAKVYTSNQINLVELPDHVHHTLSQFGLLNAVHSIDASYVSQFIQSCLHLLTHSDRLNLLHYLCYYDLSLLVNLELVPLADGTSFGIVGRKQSFEVSPIFFSPDHLVQLFPGLEAEFCDYTVSADVREDLHRIATSGITSLEVLRADDSRIPSMLQRSLQTRYGTRSPLFVSDLLWIERVWRFLAETALHLSAFSQVPLLPIPVGAHSRNQVKLLPLTGIYVCKSASGMSSLSASFASALTKLGVTVLDALPYYITNCTNVLGNFINYPSEQGILNALEQVSCNSALRSTAIITFNTGASGEEKTALVEFLSNIYQKPPSLLCELELFQVVLTSQPASVNQVRSIGPAELPPVSLSVSLLACNSSERSAAHKLGATDMSVQEVARAVMVQMSSSSGCYMPDDIIRFMIYFLKHKTLIEDSSLVNMSQGIRFVKTESGQLQQADQVYDPSSSVLKELFQSHHRGMFPHGEFAQADMLKKLKKLGLRSEQDVKSGDLIDVAKCVSDMWSRGEWSKAEKSAHGLLSYLLRYGDAVDIIALDKISSIQCLPCLQDGDKPQHYPRSLPIRSDPSIVRPAEMYNHSQVSLIGSVTPVCKPGLERGKAYLQIAQAARPVDVILQLQKVTQHFTYQETAQYKLLLMEIFLFLQQHSHDPEVIQSLRQEKCVLIESGDQFARPSQFWIQRQANDIEDLKPYRYPLPLEMLQVQDLLSNCGSSWSQNDQMLLGVLSEIQSKYSHQKCQIEEVNADFQVVRRILDKLSRKPIACDGNTPLPVAMAQSDKLEFKPAKDCTVMPDSVQPNMPCDVEVEVFFVHPDIPSRTALDLGALLLKDRALTGLEDIDYGYGQHEDLTCRLSGLLKESYTDGFSVPKELIQNADDAGASKVCFMLDERENAHSRTNLIADTMASLQGPAIWAYNDAIFSDSDFENVTKLGAGTKKEDTSKVGRFGLGFNAVYNLTDVPCFISGNSLAMFDPQVKYLGKGVGLKLDFTNPINKALLSRMPQQFQPFQNIFGCRLKSTEDTYYRGTLFRFPLRTADQAAKNKLKSESYSESKRREFLRMMLTKAGTLLLFTQSVREVEVFYLPSSCSDPGEKKCLLTVKKTCLPAVVIHPQVKLDGKTILQFMKHYWSQKSSDIRIQQRINIETTITAEARDVCSAKEENNITQWQQAWASGTGTSAKMAHDYRPEGFVPLAAAAVLCSSHGLLALKDSPPGFYNTGHLFCFLPLPEELSRVHLPVHINGTFALTSDRRGLMMQTEDDLYSWGSSWNRALYSDAVCRAYLLLLEQVRTEAAMDSDFKRYFDLWPREKTVCLRDGFYQHVLSDGNEVLPVPGQNKWVAYADARFLQPQFRDSCCGKIAWEALQKYWKKPGHLVDVPTDICKLFENCGSSMSFGEKVISETDFYKDVFFPNFHDGWWKSDHRDRLIHYALMQNNKEINQLIMLNACIPCGTDTVFRKPSEVISPDGLVANLFHASEGRFPQAKTAEKDRTREHPLANQTVSFSDKKTLQRLSELGMKTNELPWEMVLDRAKSVKQLQAEKRLDESVTRAGALIDYLVATYDCNSNFSLENCPEEMKKSLSNTAFLPVLSRPQDWPFPWAGDNFTDCSLFAAPAELCVPGLKNIVACSMKILNSQALRRPEKLLLTRKEKEVLKILGAVVEEDPKNMILLDSVLDQMVVVAEHYNKECQSDRKGLIQSIIQAIYAYLNKCLKQSDGDSVQSKIQLHLGDKSIVWTGAKFVQSSSVAFQCAYDCSPHLYRLETNLETYKLCFQALGVKSRFDDNDVLSVLEELNKNSSGSKLSEEVISLVSRLAQLLGDIVETLPKADSLNTSRVFLPDSHGIMQSACHLCVDDSVMLTESKSMKLVHGKIASETARLLGVKTKKRQHYTMFTKPIRSEPFGQNEKLTTRIKRLLQGYTFDSSLCKELLQNADDAKATECKFIMDFRHLPHDAIPSNWELLQGPALCFYNNKSFTETDMKGIQDLGVGSKDLDDLKIGQFGVGFNAVYHITDVPSFWTKVDDKEDVICVFDPNCQYVPDTDPNKPGVQFTNIHEIKQAYPDFFSGYLSTAIDHSQSGTLFRFPLRSEQMAETSEIKQVIVTESNIRDLLDKFKDEIMSCLLFLNYVHEVGIYFVKEDGFMEQKFKVTRVHEDFSDFKHSLYQASATLKQTAANVKDISVFQAVVLSTLQDSRDYCEKWLTVHRVGFDKDAQLSPKLLQSWGRENFRLLPHGGVAVRHDPKTRGTGNSNQQESEIRHQIFCTLPLPVFVNLPVHVNGHFALDHESRRNLWDSGSKKDDVRSEWNEALASHVIVPAYVTMLKQVKLILFPEDGRHFDDTTMKINLSLFHSLFPQPGNVEFEFWTKMVHQLYRSLAKEELAVFPVSCTDQTGLEWMPVVKKVGFPGYFSNLEVFFKDQMSKLRTRPVTLSQGLSVRYSNPSEPTPRKRAEELIQVLKQLNMKILLAPFHVYDSFVASGVNEVQQVTAHTVLDFLRSSGQEFKSACNIISLPKPLADTPLMTVQNVKTLIKFVNQDPSFLDNLDGLPLCLRQSDRLYMFAATNLMKPIISKFSHLLPGSKADFLHSDILLYFQDLNRTSGVLQSLTVSMLADRLQYTLTDPLLCAGRPCAFEQSKLPSDLHGTGWLRDLWKFFDAQLKDSMSEQLKETGTSEYRPDSGHLKANDKSDDRILRQQAKDLLHCLEQWCLIPVKKKDINQERSVLYPIKDMHLVVYLPAKPDQSNSRLWNILKTLPLPFLDNIHLPALGLAEKIVASIHHPRALLHALVSIGDRLLATHKIGHTILSYFSQTLGALRETCENEMELTQELRRLPVYPAVHDSLVSIPPEASVLCVHTCIPKKGLIEWSHNRVSSVCLLRAKYVPEELQKYLEFRTLATAEFYSHYLLPTLAALPHGDILTHMTFLRDNFSWDTRQEGQELQYLHQQLKSTAFINLHGTLFRAGKFFNPYHPVFKTMCSEDMFPPRPYNEDDWNSFMLAAGIISEVTPEKFLEFAHSVENQGKNNIPEDIAENSKILVEHLFQRNDNAVYRLLSMVTDVRFVLPSQWRSPEDGKLLARIARPFQSNRLISFSESTFEEHKYLVWSSSCILHRCADPRFRCSEPRLVMNLLGLQERAPKQKVFQHLKNISQALSGEDRHAIFDSLSGNGKLLKSVMNSIYQYLEENIGKDDISDLKQMALICDIVNRQMLIPSSVVIELRESEMIPGHIEKAPVVFGQFFELFKKLGAAQSVSANHYALVLEWLKGESRDEKLHVEELKIVKAALEGLFHCLKVKVDKQRTFTVASLYFPAEDKTLQKSTELIYKDRPKLENRFTGFPGHMHFFLGFRNLEMSITTPLEEVRLLPKEHQMIMLSDVVKEIIPNTLCENASEGHCSRDLSAILESEFTKAAIVRLVYDYHYTSKRSFSEESAREVQDMLSNVWIKEVPGLKTMLTLQNQPVPKSESAKPSFVDKIRGTDVPREAVIYIDPEIFRTGERKDRYLRSMVMAVKFVLKMENLNDLLLLSVLQNPAESMTTLDENDIVECDFSCIRWESVFPEPGKFIPVDQHCYLENSFCEFRKKEHVGYEVYDPAVEGEDSSDAGPVYIYATVIEEIQPDGSTDTPLLARRYRIYLGLERGVAEVSVTELYKFSRKHRQNTSRDVVMCEGQDSGIDRDLNQDLNTVLKEIRRTLTEAWGQLHTEKDRRRVWKRLLLQWHPDRNRGNELFCTHVTQKILKYVDMLQEGKRLPEVDDDDEVDGSSYRTGTGSAFTSTFYAHMNARARSYQAYHDFYTGSSRDHRPGLNPQPGEGRRWLRQAEADIATAIAAKGTCDRGQNWICYQCHQAVEKALKAAIYYQDADRQHMFSHSLPSLAYCVGDPTITDLAQQLEGRVGPHIRMRYPDVTVYSQIPADVYTMEDAIWACDIASKVIDRIRSLTLG